MDEAPVFVIGGLFRNFDESTRNEQFQLVKERYVKDGCASYGVSFDASKYNSFAVIMYCEGMPFASFLF